MVEMVPRQSRIVCDFIARRANPAKDRLCHVVVRLVAQARRRNSRWHGASMEWTDLLSYQRDFRLRPGLSWRATHGFRIGAEGARQVGSRHDAQLGEHSLQIAADSSVGEVNAVGDLLIRHASGG